MILPNYRDGSIVNLMSSIAQARGGKTPYSALKILPPGEIKKSKNIVLLVVDGLGYEYLKEKGQKTIFWENFVGKMTSVFLPTTASAITSFFTGVAPQQHAFTGWYMFLKEIGVVSAILPFVPRVGGEQFSEYEFYIENVLDEKPFFKKIKTKCFFVNGKKFVNSAFSTYMAQGAKKVSHGGSLGGLFRQIKKVIKFPGKKYIYSYWGDFDNLGHEYGIGSKKVEKHFKELDKKLRRFIKSIRGTDTTLIITADHGFVDTPFDRIVKAESHPKFQECLTLPLCGEGRTPYCYVHPSKTKQFEKYVRTKLKKYCHLFKSQDLIDKHYFGLFKPNKKLFDRVGDYILICKENYIIKDSIKDEKKGPHIGHHGGISKEELIVPLIILKC